MSERTADYIDQLEDEVTRYRRIIVPDMLEALKAMTLNMAADGGDYRDCYKAAIAAIARAEGTS